jgi:outer membrane protein assembly factor BamB
MANRTLLFAAVLGVLMAACANVPKGTSSEPPRTFYHPGTLKLTFRRELTAWSRKVGQAYEHGQPEIDPAHRRVFVGSSDHGLYAIRAEDGAVIWRFETLAPVQCEPYYDNDGDFIYFGSNDGALYKARASDGWLIYRFTTNAEVSRRPALAGKGAYFTNAKDTLMAIDAATGKLRWSQHRTPAGGMEIAGHAGAAVSGDRVYTGFSSGVVAGYSLADGKEVMSVDLSSGVAPGSEAARYLDVDTTPIPARIGPTDVIFVASYPGGVFALDTRDGGRVWSNTETIGVTAISLWREPSRARDLLLAASGLTGLSALDPSTGRTLWRRALPRGGVSAPVGVMGALLVSTTEDGVFLFSPLHGALIDGFDTGGTAMRPAAHGTRAFVMTNGGALLGLTLHPPPGTPSSR